jgi:hypothetical protein
LILSIYFLFRCRRNRLAGIRFLFLEPVFFDCFLRRFFNQWGWAN